MDSRASNPKPTPKLVLLATVSSSITIVSSLIYIAFCIVALIFRYDCDAGDPSAVPGSNFFLNTLYRVYLLDGECTNAIKIDGITGEFSVFVLVMITLSAAVVSGVVAILLISAVFNDELTQYLNIIVYGYVGVYIASLAVDLTLAAHFGMDYSFLTDFLNNSSPGLGLNYERDVIRVGAFMLMTISLKAFIGHVINIVLLILLVVYLVEYTEIQNRHEHSIHKLGAIEAFDSKRDRQPSQQHRRETYQPPRAGPQMNYGYMNDEEPSRSPMRERDGYRSEYPGNGFDRSNSWQLGPGSAGRPFSYLEEVKRPTPVRPPSSPAADPNWREPWRANAPPVPAPDYSPTPRRLKSALKSGFM